MPEEDTQSTTKAVVTLFVVFLDQSCYVKRLSILDNREERSLGYVI